MRRIKPRTHIYQPDGTKVRVGILLDVETTGLDARRDEIIELGMIKFEFGEDGRIFQILDEFQGYSEPTIPITDEITKITGITTDMVKGAAIQNDAVQSFIKDAVIVVAHNANFDRRFCEVRWADFQRKAWACSIDSVDWRAEGFEGTRLAYLLNSRGLFHTGHRASEDCRALLEILALELPVSNMIAFKSLLDNARRIFHRIWAVDAPYDLRNLLRARGYRWSDGSDGNLRSWWRDVPAQDTEDEIQFLQTDVYMHEVHLPMQKITPFNRYSDRAGAKAL